MKKLVILALAALTLSPKSFGTTSASLCGEIHELSFTTHLGRVYAHGTLLNVKNMESSEIRFNKLIVLDPKAVFKIAKGISQASVQNPEKLQQDLRNSRFYWNATVGDEEHPHPRVEDFEACLKMNVDRINENKEIGQIIEIIDLKEDGHSIIDLMN